jgi:hypothetical protein
VTSAVVEKKTTSQRGQSAGLQRAAPWEPLPLERKAAGQKADTGGQGGDQTLSRIPKPVVGRTVPKIPLFKWLNASLQPTRDRSGLEVFAVDEGKDSVHGHSGDGLAGDARRPSKARGGLLFLVHGLATRRGNEGVAEGAWGERHGDSGAGRGVIDRERGV